MGRYFIKILVIVASALITVHIFRILDKHLDVRIVNKDVVQKVEYVDNIEISEVEFREHKFMMIEIVNGIDYDCTLVHSPNCHCLN